MKEEKYMQDAEDNIMRSPDEYSFKNMLAPPSGSKAPCGHADLELALLAKCQWNTLEEQGGLNISGKSGYHGDGA